MGLIPELGSSPGGGHGNPLQYSYLENPMDRGAWRGIVHGVTKSRAQLSTHAYTPLVSRREVLRRHQFPFPLGHPTPARRSGMSQLKAGVSWAPIPNLTDVIC